MECGEALGFKVRDTLGQSHETMHTVAAQGQQHVCTHVHTHVHAHTHVRTHTRTRATAYTHLSKMKRMATKASARGRATSMSWGWA